MYKIVMYDDDDKVIEYETNNVFLMHDVAISLVQAVDFYKNWNDKDDRHE